MQIVETVCHFGVLEYHKVLWRGHQAAAGRYLLAQYQGGQSRLGNNLETKVLH